VEIGTSGTVFVEKNEGDLPFYQVFARKNLMFFNFHPVCSSIFRFLSKTALKNLKE
jgi:hypothetical protein